MTNLAFFIGMLFFIGSFVSCTKLDQEKIEKDIEIVEKIMEDIRDIELNSSSDYTTMI